MVENRLGRETSPYLLQHKDNPVAWWPWGPQALAAAKESGKPILLSVGYAACHWCHVMAHESFEDETTARVMNELFICIKVDREERLDIDAIYQSALALLGEQGGWPLTMFLTPEGDPFWGGTYFPPTARYGRPSFIAVLEGIARIFRDDGDKVASNVEALRQGLKQHFSGQAGGAVTPQLLDDVALRLMQEIDPAEGGLGGPPKFPNCAALQLIWRAYRRTGLEGYRQAVELTLEKMSLGGIYDHLGGGYARYAVDGIWLVPHFEKMLYDNALILSLLNLAHSASLNPLFDQRRRETIDWLLREMQAASSAPNLAENGQPAGEPSGGFAASLDADSEGHEGKFYVWDEAEINQLLGADAPAFKTIYDVTPQGNFEGKNILNRRAHPPSGDVALEARLAENRLTLRKERDKRIWPGWDDKVLADWNGMTIAALCEAGAMAGEASWIAAATRALSFIREKMLQGGRLYHSWRHGRLQHLATLDDLAQVALGALSHFEVTGEKDSLALAEQMAEIALHHHLDKSAGGFFTTADDAEALILRAKTASDSATPSGNGVMVEVLARLFYLTGKDSYRQVAEGTVAAFSGSLQRQFFSLASLLNGAELLESARQIVVIGQRGQGDTDALIEAVWQAGDPLRVLQVIAPGEVLHDGHPAKGKTQSEGCATAFVCRRAVCSLPLTDAAALSAALA